MPLPLSFRSFVLILAASSVLHGGQDRPLLAAAALIETEADAEAAFRDNIVKHGLFAIVLTMANDSPDHQYTLQRSNIIIQTEFDVKIPSITPQRAFDKMMWEVGSGPSFAEYGIARSIAQNSRRNKLKETVLAKALDEAVCLDPGKKTEGALFFERSAKSQSVKFSTLVILEVVDTATQERFPMRLNLVPYRKNGGKQ